MVARGGEMGKLLFITLNKLNKKEYICVVTEVLINSKVGILSQFICISNHYIVHFKYITILFVHYTSIKLKENKRGRENSRSKGKFEEKLISQTSYQMGPNRIKCKSF